MVVVVKLVNGWLVLYILSLMRMIVSQTHRPRMAQDVTRVNTGYCPVADAVTSVSELYLPTVDSDECDELFSYIWLLL